MSTEITTDDPASSDGKVEFLQYHQPPLKDGSYKINVVQEINSTDTAHKVPSSSFNATRSFVVSGERFELKPADIGAVFPPDGSLGEHSRVLPHIIFNRSTLPWERLSDEAREDVPWLALLLFDEDEKPAPAIVTLDQISNSAAQFPHPTLETGQQAGDKVSVIDVRWSLLQTLLPTPDEMALLAHVRQSRDASDKLEGDEMSVVICNRLPEQGKLGTVHLVSLEERFAQGAFVFDKTKESDPLIRLVSLKSWSFACADEAQSFKGLLLNLNREPGTLRLPRNDSPAAETRLAGGATAVPHFMRQGERTVSWYHGPLIPADNETLITLPVMAADELVRFNPTYGMFDVSYAAAWELGRLLALQSKQVSVSLYHWKRANVQQLKQAEQQLLHEHLPVQGQPSEMVALPEEVSAWFDNLSLLQGLPFNYLVPDERMLPAESIRFVRLDTVWVDCLLDGAFSIGRVARTDGQEEQSFEENPAVNPYPEVCGFLMRSGVVAGWPGLLVDAYDADGTKLEQLRFSRLSANVLLCLFSGEASRVEIHQQPEMLHFGLDQDAGHLCKTLRDDLGREVGPTLDSIPWRQESQRIIDINQLAEQIRQAIKASQVTSAQFALQMIEGVERVAMQIEGYKGP